MPLHSSPVGWINSPVASPGLERGTRGAAARRRLREPGRDGPEPKWSNIGIAVIFSRCDQKVDRKRQKSKMNGWGMRGVYSPTFAASHGKQTGED